MNFLCPSCKARYKISDERMAGRARARMNCKRCGTVIELSRELDGQFVVNADLSSGPASNSLMPEAVASPPPLDVHGEAGEASPASESSTARELAVSRHHDAAALRSLIESTAVAAGHDWFVGIDGQPVGPLTLAGVLERLKQGTISLQTQVWHDGLSGWRSLASFPQLAGAAGDLPQAIEPTAAKAPRRFAAAVRHHAVSLTRPKALPRIIFLIVGVFGMAALGFIVGQEQATPTLQVVEASPPVAAEPLAVGGAEGGGMGELQATAGQGGVAGQGNIQVTSVNSSEVIRTVSRYSPQVHRQCWLPAFQARAEPAPLAVQVTLKLTVAATGGVLTAGSPGVVEGYPELVLCVASLAKTWRFPPAASSFAVEVPFAFEAPNN